MQMPHKRQHTIQTKNVHISVLNGVLLEVEQAHCGICETGLLLFWGHVNTQRYHWISGKIQLSINGGSLVFSQPRTCSYALRLFGGDHYFNSSDAIDGIFRLWGSIPCLLLPWPFKSPGHQQKWYWQYRIGNMWVAPLEIWSTVQLNSRHDTKCECSFYNLQSNSAC